jgi:DNA-binding transcriptional ArsR family regulator
VYIFSGSKSQSYSTPEFSNILENLQNIKREVTDFGQSTENSVTYNRLIKRVDALEQSIRQYSRQLNQLERALMKTACAKLTEKQRIILHWLTTHYQEDEVYTNLIKQLSYELEIPESTVRWNLKGLREAELITAGTKDNKGITVTLTYMGRIMANYTFVV